MQEQFTFNKRLLSEILAKYPDTFVAFCELINNAIQAESKTITIDIEYTPTDTVAVSALQKVVIRDDGVGVSKTEFKWKILEVGTKSKQGGKGIGRFAALQMAGCIKIQTVAFDQYEKSFFRTEMLLDTKAWHGDSLDKVEITVNSEKLEGTHDNFYQVEITDFYGEDIVRDEKFRRIHKYFQQDNLPAAIFSAYPESIFNKKVSFILNRKPLNSADFILGEIEKRNQSFTALDGASHEIRYQFLQVKSQGKHRLFLRANNNKIQTVAHTFDYHADIPAVNQWFILVDSSFLDENNDMLRNLNVYQIEPNAENLVTAIKKHVDDFFAEKYESYRNFAEKLRTDSFYPYKSRTPSSGTRTVIFSQLAFFIEEKHRLLSENQNIRQLVYGLMDRALDSGEFELLLSEAIKLEDSVLNRFKSLKDRADLSDVIIFSEEVARKQAMLDFLHKINYSEVSKRVKERSELHKVVERLLWLFGEEYNGVPKLFSDKNLENNLSKLRQELFSYDPSGDDENLLEIEDEKVKNITDLFFFNERIVSNQRREILIVELKAPRVRIADKELNQGKKYALQIEKQGVFPKNLSYRILLVGADISDSAKASCGTIDSKNPYMYHISKVADIQAWAIPWSDIIADNRTKLSYLGNALNVKDQDAQKMIDAEFHDLNLGRLKSQLDNEQKPSGRRKAPKQSVT